MSWQYKLIKWSVFVLIFFVVLTRAYNVDMYSAARGFVHGDGYTDVNTYSAVLYFYDYGFWQSAFRPVHKYTRNSNNMHIYVYTHYPAFPDVLVGGWARILRSTKEFHLRLLPIGIAILWFWLIFHFLSLVLNNSAAAFYSSILLVCSNYFIGWSDSLHKHTLEEFFKWVYVWQLWLFYKGGQHWLRIFFLFFLAVIIANTSFEPITFLAVVTLGFSLIYAHGIKKLFAPTNVILALGFVLGLLCHFWLNVKALGGFAAAKQDLMLAFLHRTALCEDQNLCGLSLFDYCKLPLDAINRIERYFLIPGIALIVFTVLAMRKFKKENYEMYYLTLVLLLASVSWYFVMPQHAHVHHFVAKQAGLFVGCVVGVGGIEYLDIAKRDFCQKKRIKIFLHILMFIYIISMAFTQHLWQVYWQYGVRSWF